MLGFNPPLHEYPPPKEGEPPLHRAARIGDCQEIRRLVAAGERLDATFNTELDPDAHDREATPFMVAAGSSDGANVETLRVLLELGSDPKVEIGGGSAATFACQGLSCWHKPGGDAERLRFVLQAGAPLPTDTDRSNRLLCDTAATGDPERLRVLLERGLNPKGHWDPVKARQSARASMEYWAKQDEIRQGAMPLTPEQASASRSESMKKLDQEMFERESSAPSNYEIPLFRAAESGSAECVRLILDAGADAKARDSSKRTAMYYAGSTEVVRALMQAGLPLEDADEYGWSPLDKAVSDGESAFPRICALIEAGANVNATHDRGYTVFMSAVGSGRYPALLRLLVASGADPHAVTELGYNAFHAAIDVDFEANAEQSVRDTLGYLKELGVNIEQRNKSNLTPLARAIRDGNGIEVKVLCELGADPNAVCPKHKWDGEKYTLVDQPLLFHAATGSVNSDLKTEALLRAGAIPLTKDAHGFTPLMHVVASLCQDSAEYNASYQAFFKGLGELRVEGKPTPETRAEFVTEVMPTLRTYVERFAVDIPITDTSEYAHERRSEWIACIAALCAYEGWARREQLRTNPS